MSSAIPMPLTAWMPLKGAEYDSVVDAFLCNNYENCRAVAWNAVNPMQTV
jgi:hypothetical protein